MNGGFSGSPQWNSNVFEIALYITFTKWDLTVSPLPEKNLSTGSILSLLYFTYSLSHVWTVWKTCLCFEFRNLYLLQFHYPAIFEAKRWGLQKPCLFLYSLNHFHWDILPLVFHHFHNFLIWVLIVNQCLIKLRTRLTN